MKKVLIYTGLAFFSFLNAEGFISTKEDLAKQREESTKQNELEKLKEVELKQVKKSIVLFESNPIVQSLLMEFLKEIIDKSEGKYKELLGVYTNELSAKIKSRLTEELEVFRLENSKLQQILEDKQKENYKILKSMIANEVDKIKSIKLELEKKQKQNQEEMELLTNMFKNMNEKMDSYTKYIDTKFSLKAVKEIELSRILLLKEKFPIKYIKNFNDKTQISVVLNNGKEFGLNAMVTDRCRISDLNNTHIAIECIDINNKIYKNTMELEIVPANEDYILNSIQKQLGMSNKKYGVEDGESEGETEETTEKAKK